MSDVRALLLTDVVDSTQLSESLGDAATAKMWIAHDRVARDLLRAWRGREIDRTDGLLLLFDSAADAAGYASAYHRALAGLEVPLRARAGLHVGPVRLRENSSADVALGAKPLEVEGLAKPLAARIMALAGGGRTLLSAAAAAALVPTALDGQLVIRHGHYRLKGVNEPVEIAELAPPSAACPPPEDTDKAYRVTRSGDLWRPVREVRHNLVPERDAFVGREAELRRLADQVHCGTRLTSVLGPGGTGKTRLVRRYALAWLGEWPGGVYFCDLSEARSLEGIHAAMALALEVPLGKGDATAQLGHATAARGRCLVILDNFEQVQPHASATVGQWLDRAPQASFVVTSRERLHVPGESVVTLEPLVLDDEAVRLFEVRARTQQPEFVVDAANRAAVAEIVRLLDGLPLAIELAAARIRVLSPAQIVERMKDRFALLAGTRGGGARQATLKAAIDWSWELLSPCEQAALAQCAVFEGGFTMAAAESVVALDAWKEAPPVLDAITALVDKSLLRTWVPVEAGRMDIAEPFFGMYLSIHEYARGKLHAAGEARATEAEQRHGRYFASFGSTVALDALMTHGGIARRHALMLELDNLVCACRRAVLRSQPETAAACFLAARAVLGSRGPLSLTAALGREVASQGGLPARLAAEVRVALADALRALGAIDPADTALSEALVLATQSQHPPTQARVLGHLAVAHYHHGRTDEAQRCFEAAFALCTPPEDRVALGILTANLANLQMEQGHMREAAASYRAAIDLHREVGNRAAEGIALGNLGTLHHEQGRIAEARAAYDAALLIHREAGNRGMEALTLYNLGILLWQQGDGSGAAQHYTEALRIHRETGNRRGEGVVLGQIGELHIAHGEFAQARALLDEALRIHREVGNRRFEGGVLTLLGDLLVKQGDGDAGMQSLDAAVRLLREVNDPLSLAKALCAKGRAAVSLGATETARAALVEADSIGTTLGAEPASELGMGIAALRDALHGKARQSGDEMPSRL